MTDLEVRQREVNTDTTGVLKKNPKSGREQELRYDQENIEKNYFKE